MNVLVTDEGFQKALPVTAFLPEQLCTGLTEEDLVLELGPEADLETLSPYLDQIKLIRVSFSSFSDGRGFTLARRLRVMGYQHQLHAVGSVLADQYAMARRVGFDAVEIPQDLADRQPWEQWEPRTHWQGNGYLSRLRG